MQRRLLRELLTTALLLIGLAFTLYLVWQEGARGVFDILRDGSWLLLSLLPMHIAAIVLDALGWRWLLRDVPARPNLARLTWLALLREAINGLLPVARVGGELVGVRLLARMGVAIYTAAASVMVEVSLTLLNQFVFVLSGFFLLLVWIGDWHLLQTMPLLLLGMGSILLVFFWLQRRIGIFGFLQRLLGRLGGKKLGLQLPGDPLRLDREIGHLYARRWKLLWTSFWQLTGLFAGAAELWLSFVLLRHPIAPSAAVLLESLGQALRSAMFLVPGALGVQEGGFILFGAVVGIGPDVALAYSLLRRFRELALGVPILGAWYSSEGHGLAKSWRKRGRFQF